MRVYWFYDLAGTSLCLPGHLSISNPTCHGCLSPCFCESLTLQFWSETLLVGVGLIINQVCLMVVTSATVCYGELRSRASEDFVVWPSPLASSMNGERPWQMAIAIGKGRQGLFCFCLLCRTLGSHIGDNGARGTQILCVPASCTHGMGQWVCMAALGWDGKSTATLQR